MPQERYDELDFAHRVRLPALRDLDSEEIDEGYPPIAVVRSLVRRLYHGAVALFALAVVIATVLHRPTLAISVAFGAVAVYGFANYSADRLGDDAWRIPAGVALSLTIAAAFLCVTALLTALLH
jgi:hypothetical protein